MNISIVWSTFFPHQFKSNLIEICTQCQTSIMIWCCALTLLNQDPNKEPQCSAAALFVAWVGTLSLFLRALHASLIDYVKSSNALIWCGSNNSIPLALLLVRFMSSAGQRDRCTRTIIHSHSLHLTHMFSTQRPRGHCLLTQRERCKSNSLSMVFVCCWVFFFRRFGGRDQTTEDHHHGKTAGDPQKCLQELAEAGATRQRAAFLGDGPGHEGRPGTGCLISTTQILSYGSYFWTKDLKCIQITAIQWEYNTVKV